MYYKDFVAQASIAFAKEIFQNYVSGHALSGDNFFYEESMSDEVMRDAVGLAKKLAKELNDDWCAENQITVFFDPQDQPTTEIEKAIYDVSENVEKIAQALKEEDY